MALRVKGPSKAAKLCRNQSSLLVSFCFCRRHRTATCRSRHQSSSATVASIAASSLGRSSCFAAAFSFCNSQHIRGPPSFLLGFHYGLHFFEVGLPRGHHLSPIPMTLTLALVASFLAFLQRSMSFGSAPNFSWKQSAQDVMDSVRIFLSPFISD
jgi:hypothetical protein